jgi:hypothetical protein
MSSARPPEAHSSTPDSTWLCFTCREGLRVDRRIVEADNSLGDGGQSYFLPDPSINDEEVLKEPSLAPRLTDEEICELTSPHPKIAVAATFTGPPQDKTQNQDFSLTAVLRGPRNEPWAFATVADGVSTKTFWPARASRISALTAFQTVRRAICSGFDGSDEQLDKLRHDLANNLLRNLRRDQELLQKKEFHPQGWAPNVYRDYIGHSEYWYNSTLLAACLGPREGFVLWAGDGGIHILKDGGKQDTTALQSTDDLAVGTFVSLKVTSAQFRIARISYPRRSGRVEVYLASDGVDRTLQRESLTYGEIEALEDPRQARELLHRLAVLPGSELDNYSLAWLSGPSPKSFDWRSVQPLPKKAKEGSVPIPRDPSRQEAPPELPASSEPPLISPAAHPTPAVQQPPPPPASSASSSSRRRSAALLIVGFVCGLLVALTLDRQFLMATKKEDDPSPGQPEQPPLVDPLVGLREKTPDELPNSVAPTQPAVILTQEKDRTAMASGTLSPALSTSLGSWAQFLEHQPAGKKYYVVVYGRRTSMNDPRDCIKEFNRAKARSKLLTGKLAKASPKVRERLDPKGLANVCTPPAGLDNLLTTDAVRAILTDAPPDCTCQPLAKPAQPDRQEKKEAKPEGETTEGAKAP